MIKLILLCLFCSLSTIRDHADINIPAKSSTLLKDYYRVKGKERKVLIIDPFPYLRPDYPFWKHYQAPTPFPVEIPNYYKENLFFQKGF